jgi:hypothetical protein
VIAALRAREPELRIHVRSTAPHWIFRERDAQVVCSGAELELDVGMLQPNGLDLDLPATLAAHEHFCARWDEHLAREAGFLRALGAGLVVSDIAPLAFAAAEQVRVPAIALSNFSWDWILEPYAASEPRWRAVIDRYAAAYASAELLLRPPLSEALGAFPSEREIPLVVNRSRRSRAECRRALGLAEGDPRRLVLVSFGGFGAGAHTNAAREDLSAYRFVSIGPFPVALGADPIELARPCPLPHEDLVNACDAVLGKPGYGTVAEVFAHGARFLFLPREDFREIPVLLAALARRGGSAVISRADFESGRWRAALDALMAQPAPAPEPASNGAEIAAESILAALRAR